MVLFFVDIKNNNASFFSLSPPPPHILYAPFVEMAVIVRPSLSWSRRAARCALSTRRSWSRAWTSLSIRIMSRCDSQRWIRVESEWKWGFVSEEDYGQMEYVVFDMMRLEYQLGLWRGPDSYLVKVCIANQHGPISDLLSSVFCSAMQGCRESYLLVSVTT